MRIGIYGLSSQSGKAFFADLIRMGHTVIGYTRNTINGEKVVTEINRLNGIYLERPNNKNNEESVFLKLDNSIATNNILDLKDSVDVIIISLPSNYHIDSIKLMSEAGVLESKIPIILSPSRTIASPYIWQVLGENYPIICFSTCPYSCKTKGLAHSYIKRRKRSWLATIEGNVENKVLENIAPIFPQLAFSTKPALTSLNNIGAIFHSATYLLNYEEIKSAVESGTLFSFYMDGIANREYVGQYLEKIDQVRLQVAHKLGFNVFGLKNNLRDDTWSQLLRGLRAIEEEKEGDITLVRTIRKQFLEYLNDSIISAQCWLDITYGVFRISGEGISQAIARTPTYQNNSIPQLRYINEDIPTGLVPLEKLAKLYDIDCKCITHIIDLYDNLFSSDIRKSGRNLNDFSKEYIELYLKGEYKVK